MSDALRLHGLTVRLRRGPALVDQVDLSLAAGEILGIVGESGSGKTTTALALLGYALPGAEIAAGRLEIDGQPTPFGDGMAVQRGRRIAYVPQNPGRALNPSLRVADAIGDLRRRHGGDADPAMIDELLAAVGLQGDGGIGRRFPHQLSGGQQQRVCIAMALSCDPSIVVLDEPTTGLDVSTQDQILKELVRLRDERGVSMVYVSHDLAVVAGIADRVAVMYAGRIVEQGPTATVLRSPRHPYTRGLLLSTPDHVRPRRLAPIRGVQVSAHERPAGCEFADRCDQSTPACRSATPPLERIALEHDIRCLEWRRTPAVVFDEPFLSADSHVPSEPPILDVRGLVALHESRHERVVVADDISFQIAAGACVALVGESGSGKTTIARSIAGLHPPHMGEVRLHGVPLAGRARERTVAQRRQVQLIFQNSTDALNPRQTIADAIGRPAKVLRGLGGAELRDEVKRLLELVRLPSGVGKAFPAELSGGERQRAAIARALAAGPDLLLCDEITSALDVSVQAAVLEVLGDLRREFGVSLLLITHDLGVVAALAEQVIVLERGSICERGTTARVLASPSHAYTRRLLEQAPSLVQLSAAPLYT